MLKVFRAWLDRYLADEEPVLLLLILVGSLLAVLFWGDILAPIIAALALSFVMDGVVQRLTRWNMPRSVALALTFALFIGTLLGMLLVVLPLVWRQCVALVGEMPRIFDSLRELVMGLPQQYPTLLSAEVVQEWTTKISGEMGRLGQLVLSFSIAGLGAVAQAVIYLVLVPILVFFLLKDKRVLLERFVSLLPKRRGLLARIGSDMNVQIANYIRGKALEIVIVGAVSFACFAAFGLRYSALLALLVGLSVLVPFIGAAIVTVPVLVVAYMQWGWSASFVWLGLTYAAIQVLDGNVLVPMLLSEAVNLHPFSIIVAVLFFGGLWGFWGVFFAIPIATLIKAVFNAWPRLGDDAGDDAGDGAGAVEATAASSAPR